MGLLGLCRVGAVSSDSCLKSETLCWVVRSGDLGRVGRTERERERYVSADVA
jgi:hypothetical protein